MGFARAVKLIGESAKVQRSKADPSLGTQQWSPNVNPQNTAMHRALTELGVVNVVDTQAQRELAALVARRLAEGAPEQAVEAAEEVSEAGVTEAPTELPVPQEPPVVATEDTVEPTAGEGVGDQGALFARESRGAVALSKMGPRDQVRIRSAAAVASRLQLEPWLASDWIKIMQDSDHSLTLSIPTLEEATVKDEDGNPVYQIFRIPGTNTGYALKRVTPETDWMESGFDGWEVTGVIAPKEDGDLMSGLTNIIIGHAATQNTDMPLRLDAFDVRKEGAEEGTGKLPYLYRKNGFVNTSVAAYDVVGFGVPAKTLVAQMKAWKADGWTPKYDYDGPTPKLDGTPIPSNLPPVWYGRLDEQLVQEERERIRDEGLGRWLDVRRRGNETRPRQRTLGFEPEGAKAGVQRIDDEGRVERPVGEAEAARRVRPRGELRVGERPGRATGDERQPADGGDLAVERDRVNIVELAAELEAEFANATTEQMADMLTGMDLLPGSDWFDAYDAWRTAQPEGDKQGPEWEAFKAIADAHARG